MNSFASPYQPPPPPYQQVLTDSQQQIYTHHAPYNPPIITVPMMQTTVIRFDTYPVTMNCPYCRQLITTVIEEENSTMAYILCILCIFFGFILGCCLIPFYISELKDKIHICPKCQRPLGRKTFF